MLLWRAWGGHFRGLWCDLPAARCKLL